MARRSRWAVLAGAVVLLSVANVGPALALNCANFTYQEDAQAYLNANPADPEGLDGDNDGIACETLPHRPATVVTTPTTAPATTAAPAGQTRIISITPPTTAPPAPTFASGLLERTG